MERRDFLIRGALAAGSVTALGGCTEQALKEAEVQPPIVDEVYDGAEVDLPVRQRSEIAEEGVLRAQGETLGDLGAFEVYLDDQGIPVETLEEQGERGERIIELEYAAAEFVERGLLYSLGRIAGGYAALVAGGYEGNKLEASVHSPDGDTFGAFEIATGWAVQYLDGELTAAKYASRVESTAESTT